jgi:hypothetical protein
MEVVGFFRKHWGKFVLLLLFLLFLQIFEYIDEAEEALGFNSGRMNAVRNVANLAPFPTSRSRLAVKHQLGMFSDILTIYFVAKPDVISRWLQDSPGAQEAKITEGPFGSARYSLGPGKGFLYVSKDQSEVGINFGYARDGPTSNSPIPIRAH